MKDFNTNTVNNDTWLTPPEIIKSLGEFALDPCAPINRPWNTAMEHYTEIENGLLMPWYGRVWLNPPYGKELSTWLNKMALHQNGIALVFARTETLAFQNYVFPFAESIFFFKGRIRFYDIKGNQSLNANAPSVLISYTEYDSEKIEESSLKGAHWYNSGNLFLFGIGESEDKRTWKIIVGEAFQNLSKEATLEEIYQEVVSISPLKIKNNRHYKAKIRQTLQRYFERVDRGLYRA